MLSEEAELEVLKQNLSEIESKLHLSIAESKQLSSRLEEYSVIRIKSERDKLSRENRTLSEHLDVREPSLRLSSSLGISSLKDQLQQLSGMFGKQEETLKNFEKAIHENEDKEQELSKLVESCRRDSCQRDPILTESCQLKDYMPVFADPNAGVMDMIIKYYYPFSLKY